MATMSSRTVPVMPKRLGTVRRSGPPPLESRARGWSGSSSRGAGSFRGWEGSRVPTLETCVPVSHVFINRTTRNLNSTCQPPASSSGKPHHAFPHQPGDPSTSPHRPPRVRWEVLLSLLLFHRLQKRFDPNLDPKFTNAANAMMVKDWAQDLAARSNQGEARKRA